MKTKEELIEAIKKTSLPTITIEQAREIEKLTIEMWEERAETLGYNMKHKKSIEYHFEFMLGMLAVTEILTRALETDKSSISPDLYVGLIRSTPLTSKK